MPVWLETTATGAVLRVLVQPRDLEHLPDHRVLGRLAFAEQTAVLGQTVELADQLAVPIEVRLVRAGRADEAVLLTRYRQVRLVHLCAAP